MELFDPQFDPDHNSENTQSIVERMARAKWITGTNLVRPEQFWIHFTDLGKERMQGVRDVLRKAAPEFFKARDTSVLAPGSIRISAADMLLVMEQVALTVGELQPPPFSPGERDTMIGMLLAYAREEDGNEIPPPRNWMDRPR